MERAKVFTSGNSQAVRIPHGLRFDTDTVYVQRIGSALVLLPSDDPWGALFHARTLVSDDFPPRGDQPPWQERAWSE